VVETGLTTCPIGNYGDNRNEIIIRPPWPDQGRGRFQEAGPSPFIPKTMAILGHTVNIDERYAIFFLTAADACPPGMALVLHQPVALRPRIPKMHSPTSDLRSRREGDVVSLVEFSPRTAKPEMEFR